MRRVSPGVMAALDMPEDLKGVQDAYWMAQREWEQLDEAYRAVVADMLRRLPDQGSGQNRESRAE